MKMTCGHEAKKGIKLSLKVVPMKGKPFIGHGTYCKKCAGIYKARAGAREED